MKKVIHKIMSVLMALVVMVSTTSFTVDMHFCGDTLVGTAIFKEAKTCGMDSQKSKLPTDCSAEKKNCCSNSQLTIEGQDELKVSFDRLSIDNQIFITSFLYCYFDLFEITDSESATFYIHPPPEIVKSIYKLDEVYLI